MLAFAFEQDFFISLVFSSRSSNIFIVSVTVSVLNRTSNSELWSAWWHIAMFDAQKWFAHPTLDASTHIEQTSAKKIV